MTNSPSNIKEYPILPPAFNTRSVQNQRFFELHRKARELTSPQKDLQQTVSMATVGTPPPPTPPPVPLYDGTIAPSPFSGRSKEDARSWLSYTERYMTYKTMGAEAKLNYFKILMRDGAADWLDSLAAADRNDINNLTQKFKERFIASDLIK